MLAQAFHTAMVADHAVMEVDAPIVEQFLKRHLMPSGNAAGDTEDDEFLLKKGNSDFS